MGTRFWGEPRGEFVGNKDSPRSSKNVKWKYPKTKSKEKR